MHTSPLPHPGPRSGDWLKLPLPVRGARYIFGTLLILVIIAVVLVTYTRIEQQLQATLEERLSAVLRQHVSATLHFIEDTERTSKKAAQGISRANSTPQAEARNMAALDDSSLRDFLRRWVELGTAREMFIVDLETAQTKSAFPENHLPPRRLIDELRSEKHKTDGVAFGHDTNRHRIFSWNPIADSSTVLIVAVSTDELVKRLDPGHEPGATHSYAFDRNGWLTEEHLDKITQETTQFPAALYRHKKKRLRIAPEVGEYTGRHNTSVVGAWTWLDAYDIGIATEIPRERARAGIERLRQSFLVLTALVGAALLGFLALGRWTLRVREESLLMTRRLSRLSRTIQPLSAALEHDPSAVILVDQDGCVIYANAASHRVLCVNAPLIGQDADAVFETLPRGLQTALASGQDSIVAQGSETHGETLLVSSHALTIEGSQHFLYMLRPITQQVRRQEVENWKKLIRVLSHELNNALAPITSLLSSARKVNQMTHQDPRLGQIFESISERTAHLVSFIEGYREVARLPRPAPRTVDWDVFLKSIQSQKHFRTSGLLPKTAGYFDPIQLERVIINLINNSYEANSPREAIEIEIMEEEDRFRINVMDRGSGMPEAVLKQAMLPFFSTKRTGTGVGLALSREIIEAHDGQLSLANREGGGLVVSCSLPKNPPPSRSSMGKLLIAPPGSA